MKGAPDVLMNRCTQYVARSGEVKTLTADMKSTFEHVKNIYSMQGKRCLLLARKTMKDSIIKPKAGALDYEKTILNEAKTGLTLVGMVAIVDPLRPEIKDVMQTLRGAGIKINMVSPIPE